MKIQMDLQNQKGSVVILLVVMLAVISLFPVISQMSKISNDSSFYHEKYSLQSNEVAKSGLEDAISWFRRQSVQPISQQAYTYPDEAFHPKDTGDPETSATLDEEIGLVNTYSLNESKNLKARYEIKRTSNGVSDSSVVRDITASRVSGHSNGEGLAWYLESAGYIYREFDASKSFNEAPNQIVAKSIASTEIRSLLLSAPEQAALIINNLDDLTLDGTIIRGGGYLAIAAYDGGAPNIINTALLGGSIPPVDRIDTETVDAISPDSVFGVTPDELRMMADVYITTSSEVQYPLPTMQIIYARADLDVSPISGSGVLYVEGNLNITDTGTWEQPGFNGLIFIDGDLNITITGPLKYTLAGMVFVTGSVNISSTGGFPFSIIHDATWLDTVRGQIAQYRQNKPITFVSPKGLSGS